MKSVKYRMVDLDCPNCAAKIEAKINAMPAVKEAALAYATKQLVVTAEDPDALLEEMIKIARTVESEVSIEPWKGTANHSHEEHEHHHDHDDGCCHDHCECGHDHDHHEHSHEHGHDHHDHEHNHEHGEEFSLKWLLFGIGLFAAGILLPLITKVPAGEDLSVLSLLGLAFFVAAYLVLGGEVLLAAGKGILHGEVFDENFLMSLATLGAFAIGEFAEAVGVMLFFRVGEYFEHKAVERSRSAIMDAVDMRPEEVVLLDGETEKQIPAQQAKIGDILLVRPGDRIPLDGTIVNGESQLDTSPVTGESVPVKVKNGSQVYSGCINKTGLLQLRVDKVLAESMVSRILESVENAAAGKPQMERFITRFARIYTPIVVAIAILTAVVPSLITGQWMDWTYTALTFLVISCPCALVLSVPLAFFAGIGAGSRRGILFKGGNALEALKNVRAVVMDKTGTLTKGEFAVQEILPESGFTAEQVLAAAAACESHSSHPIGVSIMEAAKQQLKELPAQPDNVTELSGKGIRALADGKDLLCGNDSLMQEMGVTVPVKTEGTQVYVAIDGTLAGRIRVADAPKEEAAEAVAELNRYGLVTAMLTGDTEENARRTAAELGVQQVKAQLLPEDKLSALQALRKECGSVMFVGDGINDAPVLAGADVGAAMGTGADAAIEAADVVFMTSKVTAICEAMNLAKRAMRIAVQNVVFALVIKIAVMVLGLIGLGSMWLAVFADSGVALLCVLNSVRILRK